HFRGPTPASGRRGGGCLFEEIEQAAAKGEAVNALCQMTGLSRAGFYRSRAPRQASPVEMEIRNEMQKIAVEWPAYGYRRITVELQNRGFSINHKSGRATGNGPRVYPRSESRAANPTNNPQAKLRRCLTYDSTTHDARYGYFRMSNRAYVIFQKERTRPYGSGIR